MKYNLINKGLKFIFNPNYRVDILAGFGWYNNMDDRKYLEKIFKAVMGYSLDLDNPKTFNEKIQWLKLNDRKPEYTMMVDKFKVRDYVAEKIGNEYLIPLLGVWDDPNQINFEKLPNQFVLKCNHNSGLGMCICKDKTKLNFNEARANLRNGLNQDYYLTGREWPYKNVPRKIIAEMYMKDAKNIDLIDYKFYCFHGIPLYCQVICNRSSNETIDFYDMDWVHQDFTGLGYPHKPHSLTSIKRPASFALMKSAAEKLANNISFVRVDFYEVDGQMYFGEMTFYPASGFGSFEPELWNQKFGELI